MLSATLNVMLLVKFLPNKVIVLATDEATMPTGETEVMLAVVELPPLPPPPPQDTRLNVSVVSAVITAKLKKQDPSLEVNLVFINGIFPAFQNKKICISKKRFEK